MVPYTISPYISFIENRLFPGIVQRGVFHRLTGEILEPNERVRSLLLATKLGNRISLSQEILNGLAADGVQLKQLIEKEFLIPDGHNPLTLVADQYVVRPIQSPALVYDSSAGHSLLVRTSMEHLVYSRKMHELPTVIEEEIRSIPAGIFRLADGTRTLKEILAALGEVNGTNFLEEPGVRQALDFLTSQERQLIKFTSRSEDLDDPYKPVNTVPRNIYHSDRWDAQRSDGSRETIIDFHLHGIEDAAWEFDLIEPTVNHIFRFPSEALGGLDYGSRFCLSTLRREVLPSLDHSGPLDVLEVGGGTGTFARSFIDQAQNLSATVLDGLKLNYHILDLSPALIDSQRKILSNLLPASRHFQQDATEFNIPDHKFHLIIANEVVADFPTALVQRCPPKERGSTDDEPARKNGQRWQGDGAYYLDKYNLSDEAAPDCFHVNAGTFRFVERAWKHLLPGGTLIVSEYGDEHRYAAQSYHLNHEEFSIHFGHLASCAAMVGFDCRLLTLKEFLTVNDQLLVLNGREEHILCLNHILQNYEMTLPYAVISKTEFESRLQTITQEIQLTGYSFSPLSKGYHFGPRIADFMVLIMNKPR